MISSHADVLAAYDDGRFHSQRFVKTGAGQANDTRWQDWAFQAGQPSYDARIGIASALNPITAVRNDAIYFPDIPAGMERKLHKLFITPRASGISQATIDFVLYDLVAYYPLIDGDSTEVQEFDNTLTLPRYTDGEGLRMVMVNHVSPVVQGGTMTLEYTDSKDVDRTLNIGVPVAGINCVTSGVVNSTATTSGPLMITPDAGVTGVKRVNRLTYTIPPGGLHCIYLVKPLAQFQHIHDALLNGVLFEKMALEVDFALKDGWRMPVIKDGAHLAFFYRNNGGGRSTTFFGAADFIWG